MKKKKSSYDSSDQSKQSKDTGFGNGKTSFVEENKSQSFRETLSQLLHLFFYSRDVHAINRALSCVLSLYKADRIYLRIFNRSDNYVIFSHDAKREGARDLNFSWQELNSNPQKESLKWIIRETGKGKEIIVNDVDDLDDKFVLFRDLMNYYGLKSSLIIPVNNPQHVNGYLGIDFIDRIHHWDSIEIENLRIISDIFRNAMEHERMKEEMERSEQKSIQNESVFQIVYEKLPVGIEIYDHNGELKHINPAGVNILGTSEDKLLGVNLFDNPIISDRDKERMRQGKEVEIENSYSFEKIANEGYFESQYKNTVKSLLGKCTPLKDSNGSIYGFLQLVYDNTEDYKRKAELEYNLTKLRMALDNGKALIWEYDVENDQLTFDEMISGDISKWVHNHLNNSEMFTSGGQMAGVHPDDQYRFYHQSVYPIVNGEIDQITVTYRQYMGGKLEWLTSNFRSLKKPGNKKPSKVYCYTTVITEQREMELELIKVKETDKLKTKLMENLSHEIRTPLNAIVGFSSLIANESDKKENEEFVNIIHENNEILLQLVDNMLDLSRMDDTEYECKETDIKKICAELYTYYSTRVPPKVKLLFDYTLPSVVVCSDREKVKQVISHLLDNAVKFTEIGQISLGYSTYEDEIIKITVSDTGIGIAEKDINQLFTAFYQSDTFRKGTGLGLHLSKKIIEDLGGTIGVERKEEGACFWFTLPLHRRC